MAENTLSRNAALPYPVYGVPWAMAVPILDADGDPVTSAAGLDCEISKNADTMADIAGTESEIGNGQYLLTFTAADMTADVIAGTLKTSTAGAKSTQFSLYPRKLVKLRSGTAQGGAVGYITLDADAGATDNLWNGCLCVATIDGTVEARVISDYTGSNKQAAVVPNWNTAPDSDDTFDIYLPQGRQIPAEILTAVEAVLPAATSAALADALDGTGGVTLTLDRIVLTCNNAAGAFVIANDGGPGIKVTGLDYGIYAEATHGNGEGFYVTGPLAAFHADSVGAAAWLENTGAGGVGLQCNAAAGGYCIDLIADVGNCIVFEPGSGGTELVSTYFTDLEASVLLLERASRATSRTR